MSPNHFIAVHASSGWEMGRGSTIVKASFSSRVVLYPSMCSSLIGAVMPTSGDRFKRYKRKCTKNGPYNVISLR